MSAAPTLPQRPPEAPAVRQETEGGSSVKLVLNARGDTQIEVKVRADDEPAAVEEAASVATRIYDTLTTRYARGASS